jgi:hypothetical protein
MEWNLKFRDALLSQAVDIFQKLESEDKSSTCQEVVFIAREDEEVHKTSPANALGYELERIDGQCQGMTQKGRRCRMEAAPGSPYCLTHEKVVIDNGD